MTTHEENTYLYRKLVEVIGYDATDTLFTLLWRGNGWEIVDFRAVYGPTTPSDVAHSSGGAAEPNP